MSSRCQPVTGTWRKGASGLTLIEVAIATLVIALGFMGIMGTSTHVMRVVRMAREETRAITAAQHILEEVKAYSWTRLSLMEGQTEFDITNRQVFEDLVNPACSVTVSNVTGEVGRLRLISVLVSWERMNGETGERELSSMIARKKRLL